ncbi:MAG TPA: AcvB/VirJ family lysyl-phosphatidylglycerol hydrolase [Terriglobia bacterium]|nr:AcvB/VirJ family lysyl-phosphatidylglycerol hydrolase [Terriglobia bacterium]
MKIKKIFLPLLLLSSSAFAGQDAVRIAANIRGVPQDLYYCAPVAPRVAGDSRVLFAPGDGGWRGFAITIAQTMASWGYDVYGLDTNRYLSSFTRHDSVLTENDVMSDFAQFAAFIKERDGNGKRVHLIGWSEGAGLSVLAGSSDQNKNLFVDVIAIGLGENNILGWRSADYLTYLTKKEPNEPHFQTAPYLPGIAPLPVFIIQSTTDESTKPAESKRLFDLAREPKRYELIEARNHRFDGNHEEFFRVLRDALQWTVMTRR